MWGTVVHRLFGRAVARYLMARAWSRGGMPYPDDLPVVHGSGPDPDRILMIGGTLVRGIGVRSYELGIAGNLARQLAARTAHGADIEAHGIPMLTTGLAGGVLSTEHLQRFDGIVLFVGNGEVLTMRPMRLWRRDIDDLLATIAALTPDGPPVLITAVPPIAAAFDVPPFVRRRIERAIARMDVITRRACEESGIATFVDFSAAGPLPHMGSKAAEVYQRWASAIVTPLARAMAVSAPDVHAHYVPIDELERQHALDDLGVIGSQPDATVDHIVEMARDMLGVTAASLTFIDHDRQWMMSASGIEPADIPRTEAICNTTIQTPGVYIVEDAAGTSEFQNASWVAGREHIRAYAGYPVEAPGGQRVGALCVMDRSPRQFTPDDVATLRDLALRAQRELWMAAAS